MKKKITTTENITEDQCNILATEAAEAGDEAMCRTAYRAANRLRVGERDGEDVARCAKVIRENEAKKMCRCGQPAAWRERSESTRRERFVCDHHADVGFQDDRSLDIWIAEEMPGTKN